MMFISSVALTLAVVTGVYALSSINQTTTGGLQFGKETYPLVLNIGEGATLSGDEINSYTYSSTSAFALPDSSYATKTGYTFAGWYENQDLTGQAVTSIPAKTRGTKTFYAKWDTASIVVTLDPNGGNVSPTSLTVKYNSTYGTLPTPTRTGYTFDGWYTSPSGGEGVTSSTTVTNASAHTLYAHWTENAGYLHSGWKSKIPSVTSLTSIKFTNTKPTTETVYQIGATDENSTAYWAEGNTSCFGVYAYVNGTKLTIYSPSTIYSPKNSSYLFSSSSSSGQLTNLTSITFNNVFDTSLVTDMSYMFYSCRALTTLDLSSFDTSLVTDMSCMFSYCRELTTLDVSSFNTSSVIDMSRMFQSCSALTTLDVSSFNTSSVTDMPRMFYYCNKLTTLDLSGFDTSKVTNMSEMFSFCNKLTTLDLNSFDTSKVTSATNFLSGCSALTTIHTPKIVGSVALPLPSTNSFYTVEDTPVLCPSITSEFANKTIAKGITVTLNANGGSVSPTTIIVFKGQTYGTLPTPIKSGSTFAGWYTSASGGEEVTSSTTVTNASAHTIYAHWIAAVSYLHSGWQSQIPNVTSLTSIEFTNTKPTTETVYQIGATDENSTAYWTEGNTSCFGVYGYVDGTELTIYSPGIIYAPKNSSYLFSDMGFYQLTSLTSLTFNNIFNTSLVTDMSYMFFACIALTELNLSSFDTSLVTDMSWMFYSCSALTELDLSSFNTTNVTSMSQMFSYCSALTELDLSSFNKSLVTDMRYMFDGCSALTTLDLSSFDTSLVTDMFRMFSYCYALTELNLSSFNTSNVTNMSEMFSYCYALTELDLSSFDTSSVTDMSSMFSSCSALTTLDLSNFDTSKVTNMTYMFLSCSALTTLDLSNFDTSKVTNMSFMFQWCSALTELDLSSFDTSLVTYMSSMFAGCNSLMSITFGDAFVTSNVTDMSGMFHSCSALTTLDLSSFDTSKVTNMSSMFYNCIALTTLDLSSFDTSLVTSATDFLTDCSALTTIHTPKTVGSVALSLPSTNSFYTVEDTPVLCPSITSEFANKTIAKGITVTLNANGGSVSPTTKIVFKGQTYGTLPTPTRTGHTFDGWYTSASGGEKVTSSTTVTNASVHTLYAHWNAYTYTVSYNGNGATGGSTASSTHTYDVEKQLTANGYTRSYVVTFNNNYTGSTNTTQTATATFNGWATSANGAKEYNNQQTVKNLTTTNGATVTLYANWTLGSVTLPTPTRAGYTFAGWYPSATGGSKIGDAGEKYTPTAATTLYARWTENASYLHNGWKNQISNVTSITSIEFTNAQPTTGTPIQIGATDENSTAYWAEGNTSCFGVYGYVDGTKLTIYSPATIYAPKYSMGLFGSSNPSFRLTNLTSITFNNIFDTSLVTNMSYMFLSCSALTTLDLSSFDTSKVTSMSYMFDSCSSLERITFGNNFNTSSVTFMSGMFQNCSKLTTLDVSSFDTSSVKAMSFMFFSCSGLTELDVSSFNTSLVTNMSRMFYSCRALTTLDLSSFDTSLVTNMSSMFSSCSSLEKITFGNNFNTPLVTNMSYMFAHCYALTTLDVSSFDTSKVTNATGFLSSCSALTTIHTPKTVGSVELGLPFNDFYTLETPPRLCKSITSAFQGVTIKRASLITYNITYVTNGATWVSGYTAPQSYNMANSLTLPTSDKLVYTGYVFEGWYTTSSFTGNVVTSIPAGSYGNKTYYACWRENASYLNSDWQSKIPNVASLTSIEFTNTKPTTGTDYQIGVTDENSTTEWTESTKSCYGVYAYVDGTGLTIYSPGENVYAPKDASYLFDDLIYLDNIRFGNLFNTSKTENMQGMFHSDLNLTTLDLSSFKFSQVENLSLMFFHCADLTTITADWSDCYPKNVAGMFSSCSSLTNLDLSYMNLTYVNDASNMFAYCNKLKNILFPDVQGNFYDTTNMSEMFAYCTSMVELDLSTFSTYSLLTMYSMFEGCSSLEAIEFSSSFRTSKIEDMSNLFWDCRTLSNYDISHFETSMVKNMSGMFKSCSSFGVTDLSWMDTSKVLDMSRMFQGTMLSLDDMMAIDAFDTSNVENMSYMFYGSTFNGAYTSNLDTAKVKNMESMFSACNNLTTLDLSNFDTSKVTNMSNMFYNCSKLTTLDLSNFDTSKVTNMSNMFYNCSKLTTLDLSSFDTSFVTNMSWMFYGCSSLASVDMSSFNIKSGTNVANMFSSCTLLKTIISPTTVTPSVSLNTRTGVIWTESETLYNELPDGGITITAGAVLHHGWKSKISTSGITNIITQTLNIPNSSGTNVGAGSLSDTSTYYYDTVKANIDGSTMYISSYFEIFAPSDSSYLFNFGFSSYDFSNLDFSFVSSMSYMLSDSQISTYSLNVTTGNLKDMSFMFSGCDKLSKVNLWAANTSNVTNMASMFADCQNLTEVVFKAPNTLLATHFSTESVASMHDMFAYCRKLTTLDLSGFNTSNVTEMGGMFRYCNNLDHITFGNNFNTSLVTDMSNIFNFCETITTLDLSNFDTSLVTNMSGMFSYCSGLESITFGDNFDTSFVTNMQNMFFYCSKLATLDLSSFNIKSGTNVSAMLSSCDLLKTIVSPATVAPSVSLDTATGVIWVGSSNKTLYSNLPGSNITLDAGAILAPNWKSKVTTTGITSYVFQENSSTLGTDVGATSLTETPTVCYYTVKAYTSGSTMYIRSYFKIFAPQNSGGLFSNLNGRITFTNFDTSQVTNMNSMFAMSSFSSLNLSSFNTAKVTVMSEMFAYFTGTSSLSLTNFNTANVITMQQMFSNCKASSINLSSFNTSKVTNMQGMFSYAGSLKTLTLSTNFKTSNVTDMSNMFSETGLTSLSFNTSFNTSKVTNMASMFSGCSKLTSLTFNSNFNTSNVTYMGYMFSGCSALKSISFGTNFKTTNVTDMSYMFSGCSSLTSISLSGFNTAKVTNMSYMFNYCSGLTSISLSSFNTAKVTNMSYMFNGCSGLTTLSLTSFSLASITSNQKGFIDGCSNLNTINTPSTISRTVGLDISTAPKRYRTGSFLTPRVTIINNSVVNVEIHSY